MSPRDVIYHIARRDEWRAALEIGAYRTGSLETEGFIHCSLRRQVLPVANTLYRGQENLVLLEIDPSLVTAEIRHEGEDDRFPHIYGSLDLDAVLRLAEFQPQPDGAFAFPPELA